MHVATFLMTVLLSIGGSWYLQNNLSSELNGQVMDQITEHSKELMELRLKVNTQAAEIKQLKDDNKMIHEKYIKVSICKDKYNYVSRF